MENTDQHILEEPEVRLVPANLFKRLINYIADWLCFSIILAIVISILASIFPIVHTFILNLPKKPEDVTLANQLSVSVLYGLYMSVMETVLKGKTIAKYVTGTRAVTANGLPADAQTAFTRGLIRMVPLESFSILVNMLLTALPRAWHDVWSGSVVVDESKSILPKSK